MVKLRIVVIFAIISIVSGVSAQTAPDAGQLLREQPRAPTVAPAKPVQISPSAPAATDIHGGPRILVKGFRITGAVLVSEAELVAQLQGVVGQELSFSQLEGLSPLLTGYYAQRGYLARVILPPQDIKDGIVNLQVIEGKRGSLRIDSKSERIDAARVHRFIEGRIPGGSAMDIPALGEALTIVREQPGIDAKVSLTPGKSEGEIDLVITANEKPLLGFYVGPTNYGSRGTGEYQVSGAVTLANPTGHFDAASLLLNTSEGTDYVRADYSLAVGERGLRLGVNASSLRYHLTQDSFDALDAAGSAKTVGLTASYPLARRNDLNLSLTGSIDHERLIDRTVVGETSNRHVTFATIGLGGYTQTRSLGDGATMFGASLTVGESDQRNAAARAVDRITRRVKGNFTKLGYNAGYQYPLSNTTSLLGTLRGQFANKNLDSSARMSLGGPNAIRAYPTGEALGDEAWLANLSLSHRLGDTVAANVFVDTGRVTLNRDTWANWNAGNSRLDNRYSLSGIGVGLDWRIGPAVVTASIATPLGSNPGRDANDKNIDGSPQHRTRGWIGANAQF